MKFVVRVLILITFVLLTPLFVLLVAMGRADYSAAGIKHELKREGVYSQISSALYNFIDDTGREADRDDPINLLGPFLKREITPQFLQLKTETLVDDTQRWVTDKTSNPPSLSFSEFKERLMTQNPQIIPLMKEAAIKMKKQNQLAVERGESNSNPTGFDLEKFIDNDFSISLENYLEWIIIWRSFAQIALIIIGATLLILIVGILVLSETVKAKLRWLGSALLLSAIWNLPFALFAAVIVAVVTRFAGQNYFEIPSWANSLVIVLTRPLINSYIQTEIAASIVFFLGAVGSFMVSFFIKSKPISDDSGRRTIQK